MSSPSSCTSNAALVSVHVNGSGLAVLCQYPSLKFWATREGENKIKMNEDRELSESVQPPDKRIGGR